MLPENETPELSEELKDEANLEETQAESSTNSNDADSVDENASESDTPSSENTSDPSESEESKPTPETELKADESEVQTTKSEELKSEDSSPESTENELISSEQTVEEEKEAEAEQVVAPKPKEVLPPLNQALLPKINELVSDKEKRHQLLTEATVTDLILLLESYNESGEVAPNIQKVGLVKRSYDALKYREDIARGLDERFRDALAAFNKMRTAFQAKADELKAVNSKHKKDLLEKLKEVVDAEDAMRINEVRAIQDEWKSIGHVLREDIEPLYREYRFLLDKFYKLREMHFELLDYDRRINLQEKEKLIADAEDLIPPEEDRENIDVWREKMDQLTELQQQWKAIGHVPREDMERINNEYRAVIDRFFEVRQGFMEIQDQLRQENGDRKQQILEKMTPFAAFNAEKPRAWNEATRELRSLQEEWKEVGQAPQAVNSELWSKYRELCNAFFNHKSEFFKRFDEFRAENLVKKRELVERAEALKDSSDFEQTAKELKQLQREWKTIGPVPERHSNKLWNRFRAACDAFFENRREHYSSLHEDENTNLDAKKALIEEVKKLKPGGDASPEVLIGKIKELQAKWKTIGKVPYKEKDKIWHEFRGAIDAFFDSLSLKRGELRKVKMRADIESVPDSKRSGAIKSKISKIRRRLQQSQEKIDQYSTNIQFIAKGKSGDKLRNQIQAEIDKEVVLADDLKKQIKQLNEMLKNPPKKEEPKPKVEKKLEEEAKEGPMAEEKVEEEVKEGPTAEEKVEEEVKEEPTAEEKVEEEAKEEPKAEEKLEEGVKEEPMAETKVEEDAKEEPTAEEKVEEEAKGEPTAETKVEEEAKTEAEEETSEETVEEKKEE